MRRAREAAGFSARAQPCADAQSPSRRSIEAWGWGPKPLIHSRTSCLRPAPAGESVSRAPGSGRAPAPTLAHKRLALLPALLFEPGRTRAKSEPLPSPNLARVGPVVASRKVPPRGEARKALCRCRRRKNAACRNSLPPGSERLSGFPVPIWRLGQVHPALCAPA